MDVTLTAILELDKVPVLNEDETAVKQSLYRSLILALKHSALFKTRAIALSVVERRKAFLEKCSFTSRLSGSGFCVGLFFLLQAMLFLEILFQNWRSRPMSMLWFQLLR
jgi:hypothetical protein